jgi:predicted N-acetyltransferase YhbS
MSEEIRFIKADEYQELMRFLERAYGHGRGFFIRNSPRLRAKVEESSLILKSEDKIAGHVGIYPLELVVGPSTIIAGGIGAVGVDPKTRGRGYMSNLMERSIQVMEERKMPLSVLWGNRQRYMHFGYEVCGQKYQLDFDRRSIARAGIEPMEVEEVDPCDETVVKRIRKLHATLNHRVVRHWLEILSKPKVRVFMGVGGYLISLNEYKGDLVLQEVVSPNGKEAELILGAMDWTFAEKASLEMEPITTPSQRQLLAATSSWRKVPQGMFRIINWPDLCQSLSPYFAQEAKGLPAFELAIGCSWKGNQQIATLTWDGSTFTTTPGKETEQYIELEEPQLVTTLLGGPYAVNNLGLFGKLLPVPIHIPNIDHV